MISQLCLIFIFVGNKVYVLFVPVNVLQLNRFNYLTKIVSVGLLAGFQRYLVPSFQFLIDVSVFKMDYRFAPNSAAFCSTVSHLSFLIMAAQ